MSTEHNETDHTHGHFAPPVTRYGIHERPLARYEIYERPLIKHTIDELFGSDGQRRDTQTIQTALHRYTALLSSLKRSRAGKLWYMKKR